MLVGCLVFACNAPTQDEMNSTVEKAKVQATVPEVGDTTHKASDTNQHKSGAAKRVDNIVDTTFYFAIETNGMGYHSKSQKYRRLYSGGQVQHFTIALTEAELKEIYDALVEANFKSFPEKFEPNTAVIDEVEPNFFYRISANIGGVGHVVFYSDYQTDAAMRQAAKPFLALFTSIYNIIQQNEAVAAIPKSDLVWE